MSYLLPGKRSKELSAVAEANRLTFTIEDTVNCTELPFTLFVQGTGHSAQNVMTGRLHGMTVRGFDFPYLRNDVAINQAALGTPGEAPVVPYDEGKQYGCALVALTTDLPFVHLAPRSRKRQLPSDLEVVAGRADVAKLYQCWAVDRARAAALLDHPVVADFLVGTRGQFEFELCGPGVMSMVSSIRAEDFPAFMAMTVRFAEALQAALAASSTPAPAPAPAPAAAPTPAAAPAPVPAPVVAPPPAALVAAGSLPSPPPSTADLPLPPPPPDAASAPLPPPPR